jgi:hypothetical protein
VKGGVPQPSRLHMNKPRNCRQSTPECPLLRDHSGTPNDRSWPPTDRFAPPNLPLSARNPGPSASGKSRPELPALGGAQFLIGSPRRSSNQDRPKGMRGNLIACPVTADILPVEDNLRDMTRTPENIWTGNTLGRDSPSAIAPPNPANDDCGGYIRSTISRVGCGMSTFPHAIRRWSKPFCQPEPVRDQTTLGTLPRVACGTTLHTSRF